MTTKTFFFVKTPFQTTDTLGYSAGEFAKYLRVDKRTIQKYANSNTAFEEITPCIQKKKTASNRWEAREVKLLEDKATDMSCYGEYRDIICIQQDILLMFLSYP